MLNNERFHASRLSPAADRVELLDPDMKSPFIQTTLHLSAGEAATNFPDSGNPPRRSPFGLDDHVKAYASSEWAKDTAPIASRASSLAKLSDIAKRAVDITVSLIVLLITWPFYLLIAGLVCATSKGPALFRQTRLGKDGAPFTCLKFRTMVEDAELQLAKKSELSEIYLQEYKIKDDPRITSIGKLLRATSLDELPQFLNVLDGSMSLVGPRPIVPAEIVKYGEFGRKLLSVRPGLTGVWQVCGRSNTSYNERVVMDMYYVDAGSVSMDIKLLWSTVPAVIYRRGAY